MIKIFAKTREITEKKLLRKKEEESQQAEKPPLSSTDQLLTDILAELKKQNTGNENN